MLSAPPRTPKTRSSRPRRKPTVTRTARPQPALLKQWKQRLKKWWAYHGQPKRLMKYGFLGTFWCGIILLIAAVYLFISLPDINQVVDMDSRPTVVILDRNDKEIARLGDTQGELLTVKDMSPNLIEAVQAIEDRRFYHHLGIDPLGLGRALWVNLTSRGVSQGGSTITQQLAKNLFLSPERTISRKVKEAALALYLEYKYSKDEILAAYLNRVYFGAGAYGVDAAARIYFNASARNLTVPQAAMLAGLLKAPARYSPANDPKLAAKRAKVVVIAMEDAGYLTEKEAKRIVISPLPKKDYSAAGNLDVHYFADWVIAQSEVYIGENAQNLIIRTTLDGNLQHHAAGVLQRVLDTDGKQVHATQGAVISMTTDGAILAMVGGADYSNSEFNRATQALRQPGSAFKPFVYLAALETGSYTPDSWVEDAPVSINGYKPTNYDGRYLGGMSLQSALANSVNTVAVKLLSDVGVGRTKRVAQRLGITDPLNADLSLALGTSGVRLINLTAAYATLGHQGRAVEPYGIRDIRTGKGNKVLFTRPAYDAPVLVDAGTVGMMNQMLQAVVQYGTGTRARLGRPVAGKTGTSQNYRDALFVGYTPDVATGVWVGNDDNTPMKKVTGGSLPATIWHDVMEVAVQDKPSRDFSGYYNDGLPPSRDPMVKQQSNGLPFNDMLKNLFNGSGDIKPDNTEYINNN